MSTDLDDRVSELLSSVRKEFESATIPDDVSGDSPEEVEADVELTDHAATAREILEANEPEAVLEAVGLAELPDGSEPSSIPEAIARGPSERVRDLHALVTLSSLAEWGPDEDTDELGDVLSDLREALQSGEESVADGEESDEGSGGEVESEDEMEAEPDESDLEDTRESGDAEDDSGEEDAEDGSAIEGALKAAGGTTVEEFSEDVESLRGRLEALTGDGESDEGDDAEDESDDGILDREGDEGILGDDREDEAESDEADEDDTFGFGDGTGGSDRGRMYSTMPPSPSRRADMRAVRRHSTMPDRN